MASWAAGIPANEGRKADIMEWIVQHLAKSTLGQLPIRRKPGLAACLAAALIVPLVAFAASIPEAGEIPEPQLASDDSMWTMTEEDLGQVTTQSLSENLPYQLRHASNGRGTTLMGKMAKVLSPLSTFLEADISISDVVYDPANAAAHINPDGSITLGIPRSIGELNFEHVHIKGDNNMSLGSFAIRGIDLSGTTIRQFPTSQPPGWR